MRIDSISGGLLQGLHNILGECLLLLPEFLLLRFHVRDGDVPPVLSDGRSGTDGPVYHPGHHNNAAIANTTQSSREIWAVCAPAGLRGPIGGTGTLSPAPSWSVVFWKWRNCLGSGG